VIGEVSTHQYIGGSVEPEEREKIARNLGPINKVMLLTNRGALCCGETVEEAFFNVYNTVVACETQLKLMPAGVDNLSLISEESKKAIFEASRKPPIPQQQSSAIESSALAEKLEKRWRIGGAEFEALMRMLDNAVSLFIRRCTNTCVRIYLNVVFLFFFLRDSVRATYIEIHL